MLVKLDIYRRPKYLLISVNTNIGSHFYSQLRNLIGSGNSHDLGRLLKRPPVHKIYIDGIYRPHLKNHFINLKD